MTSDWRDFCPEPEFAKSKNTVSVALAAGRSQKITVREDDESYLLTSLVAGKAAVASKDDLTLFLWRVNRAASLVHFRVDDSGRVIGESWMPRCGLEGDEFRIHLRCLAMECDRLELGLTGKDVG